jgi:hypothetical protein
MEEYRIIRGARIVQYLDELYEDSTVPQLRTNIVQAFPNTRKRQHVIGEVTIANVQFIPFLGTKFLHVKSTSRSNGNAYKQAVQFMRVDFDQEEGPNNITFTAADGRDYHMQPIILTGHNVKVRCNCLDFYHRFAAWNHQDNSIVGRAPLPYQRRTNTRPEVNPDHVPGMCKHLLKLMDELRRQGIVR